MRVVIQRVTAASVTIDGNQISGIGKGLLILLGIETADNREDVHWLAEKISMLRIFSDPEGKMNLSINDIKGQILVVSQFTLHSSTKKGNRPSFIYAARPEQAVPLYEMFIEELQKHTGLMIEKGIFGADMQVTLTNDGPVTIIMDSKSKE